MFFYAEKIYRQDIIRTYTDNRPPKGFFDAHSRPPYGRSRTLTTVFKLGLFTMFVRCQLLISNGVYGIYFMNSSIFDKYLF
jgi:hypothetical protein